MLGALDKLPAKSLDNVLVLGELALDGTLRSAGIERASSRVVSRGRREMSIRIER